MISKCERNEFYNKHYYNEENRWTDPWVDFLVRVWVDSSAFFAYQADMKRKVKEALDAGGVEIPFPTRTIMQAAE